MYLRYRAKYYNEKTDKEAFGFFLAADYLKKKDSFQGEGRAQLEELIHYFDHNLPIPDYYQDEKNRQKAKSATSWFKDTATGYIKRMNELAVILESNNVEVERINARKLPGKLIYEDEFQVTVIPFRDLTLAVK
ncbi:hypothetical protein N8482_00705 [Chitinophagales bacterium]|nr:hypothetical protein [Chitinophagales bacterium]